MFGSANRGTPDRRGEHPRFHAPATREPPDSGNQGPGSFSYLSFWLFAKGCFGATQTDIIVANIRLVPVAEGARQVVRLIVPGATPQHALCAPARKAAPI